MHKLICATRVAWTTDVGSETNIAATMVVAAALAAGRGVVGRMEVALDGALGVTVGALALGQLVAARTPSWLVGSRRPAVLVEFVEYAHSTTPHCGL